MAMDQAILAENIALREEVLEQARQIVDLQERVRSRLTGVQFLILLLGGSITAAFVFIGIIVAWQFTANPTELGPFLNEMLLVVAIFGNPVSALVGAITPALVEEVKFRMTNGRMTDEGS